MCEFLSFLVHERADKLPKAKRYLFGDLRSHSGTAELHGITYGKPDIWREVEWTSDDVKSLVVRGREPEQTKELTLVVLEDFPTRARAIEYVARTIAGAGKRQDARPQRVHVARTIAGIFAAGFGMALSNKT